MNHHIGFAIGLLLLITFFATVLLTGLSRRYALHRMILDIPNERSSHDTPTPRGGGLAIAVTLSIGTALLGWLGVLEVKLAWALLGGGILVAGIGWLDDHRHVPPHWRVMVHVLAAIWAIVFIGGIDRIQLGGSFWHLGWLGSLLAVIAIVWLTNLYNFMDGIDGLAGLEGVTTGLCAAFLLWWSGDFGLSTVAALIAISCGGFLWWNWPPAKIFMGDVGSSLLGYCFAVLALVSEKSGEIPAVVWIILLAVFIMDATFTLIARVLRGEQWYTAHRSHAYQRGVQLGYSHCRVTTIVGGINVLILFPLAVLAVSYPVTQIWIIGTVLVVAWISWKAVQDRYTNITKEKCRK